MLSNKIFFLLKIISSLLTISQKQVLIALQVTEQVGLCHYGAVVLPEENKEEMI